MTIYYPNWFDVLRSISNYVTDFRIGVELITVEQNFRIIKVTESNYTITNITDVDPNNHVIVYELLLGEVITYDPTDKWESFLEIIGKPSAKEVVNGQHWKYVVGVNPDPESKNY